jgi:hypothetical protein
LVKNRQTRRQPWKKQLTGDNPLMDKKQIDNEKTLEKTITGDKGKKTDRTRRKPWAKTRNHPKTNGEQKLVC